MEVDPALGSLASQPKQEEKKLEEPMAPKEKEQIVVPPVLPQQIEGEQVVTQESEEVIVTPTIENSLKEKALVPENEKADEGVAAKKIEGQTSALMPSAPEKVIRPLAPLKPINENVPASDDVQPMEISEEEIRKNPQESFLLFQAEHGPNGPAFDE
jgi:hypothetical protein